MEQKDINGVISVLGKLGIISDRRSIKEITAGPFSIKYPVSNYLRTTEYIGNLVNENAQLEKYHILKLILDDVIEMNISDFL
jgi:hypothetical protein